MEKGIAEFQRLFEAQKDFIMQDSTKRVSNALVRISPVADEDGGEFVADWDAAIGGWPADTVQPKDPKRTQTRRRLQEVFKTAKFGKAVFFEDNDPVAVRLEFGYSKKAPQGVVRLVARKWRGFVKGAGRAALNKAKKRLVID